MPGVGGFAQIAPYLTHPLVLTRFVLLLFFGFLRTLLKSKVMPTVSQRSGGQALLRLLRYGFLVALAVIVLGFALAFFRTERETVDVDATVDQLVAAKEEAAAHKARLTAIEQERGADEEEIEALRAAVAALANEAKQPDPPPGIDRALALLAKGETGQAEAIFQGIVERRSAEGAAANREAAAAARHLGALAYLDDTQKAIDAYETATRLDPDDTWSWIFLGRLYQRAGKLAAAEQAFERARVAAERADNERDIGVAYHELGMMRRARGDLTGASDAYQRYHAVAEKLAAQDLANAEWQRDLSVSFNKIGDVQRARGNLDGALKAYEDSLAIRKKL
ncbi:MAG TPA: tetratricopeptide repeat protein, partial [Geminicoccaceae bacterium]|nr:tetratricopeptide repeat protein [Geminicoccaceae bacterium]